MKTRIQIAAVLAVVPALMAWDTKTIGPANNEWQSVYVSAPEAGVPGDDFYLGIGSDPSRITGNEHAELSHIAIQQLGWTQLYGELPTVIDLNESVYRRGTLQVELLASVVEPYGDVLQTPLTERTIPHPARFAGAADFSYSIADWLNKNQYCPALPSDTIPGYEDCHTFGVWLGAVLNASHFGDQAAAIYRHYHRIALALGDRARVMGERMQAAIDAGTGDQTELEAFVREAELEALIYEAFAQHYLQDRWSSGHMWNRWSSPSYEGLDTPITTEAELGVARVVGGFSGMIHGAEAILGAAQVGGVGLPRSLVADPMCSPLIETVDGEELARGVEHVDPKCNGVGCLHPGVGDYRLRDMMRGEFGRAYYQQDYSLDVSDQRTDMLACSAAGWADVARRLWTTGDGQGVLGLAIPTGTPEFTSSDRSEVRVGARRIACWDHWATNTAMSQGRLLGVVLGTGQFGRLFVKFAGRYVRLLEQVDGKDIVRLRQQMVLAKKDDAEGTTLARTHQQTEPKKGQPNNLGMIDLQGTRPGQAYLDHIPTPFHDPMRAGATSPFDALPDHSTAYGRAWGPISEHTEAAARPGLDKHTIYGFFNQAHADYWCQEAPDKLPWNDDVELLVGEGNAHPRQGVRMPVPRPEGLAEQGEVRRRLDACILLADRLYRGTRQDYTGGSAERRRLEHGGDDRPVVDAPCDVFTSEDHAAWEDNPRDLHPGYVSVPDPDHPEAGPYASGEAYERAYYRSIANWCEALPVVNVGSDDVAVNEMGEPIVVTPGFTGDPNGSQQLSFATSVIEPEVTIYGYNFGEAQGRIRLESQSGCVDVVDISPLADVVSWSDQQITFTVNNARFVPDLYRITVIRDDRDEDGARIRSVGRALLDVRRAAFTGTASPGAPLSTTATNRDHRVLHPHCEGGQIVRHEIWDCTDVDNTMLVDCGDDAIGAGTALWNADTGPFDPQPGPYDQHQWSVEQAGECTDLVFPSAVCPDDGVSTYGLVYRFERLSEDPISATDRTWRFTLAWERPDAP